PGTSDIVGPPLRLIPNRASLSRLTSLSTGWLCLSTVGSVGWFICSPWCACCWVCGHYGERPDADAHSAGRLVGVQVHQQPVGDVKDHRLVVVVGAVRTALIDPQALGLRRALVHLHRLRRWDNCILGPVGGQERARELIDDAVHGEAGSRRLP